MDCELVIRICRGDFCELRFSPGGKSRDSPHPITERGIASKGKTIVRLVMDSQAGAPGRKFYEGCLASNCPTPKNPKADRQVEKAKALRQG